MHSGITSFYFIAIVFAFIGCKKDVDSKTEPCPAPYIETGRVAQDTICYGNWIWIYTIRQHQNQVTEEWFAIDSIYPGEQEGDFEVINNMSLSIDTVEIRFVRNDFVASGCYKRWYSFIGQVSTGPSDSIVAGRFTGWDSEIVQGGGVIINVYLPEDHGDDIYATITGTTEVFRTNENGRRYRSYFRKVD